ncbi:hypothetical protein KA005_53680 [bacterium]|nr:hypothetical protein [bacterium]
METKKFLRCLMIAVCIGLLPFGCGASNIGKKKASLIEVHKPVIAEKTGQSKRPDWTSEKPFFEDNSGLHFTGGYMGGADYALTLRLAKSEATKNLLESIEIKTRAEFSSAIHGKNRSEGDLGRYVTDVVAWTVDNLRIGNNCMFS